jgi:hypothetical protein
MSLEIAPHRIPTQSATAPDGIGRLTIRSSEDRMQLCFEFVHFFLKLDAPKDHGTSDYKYCGKL